MRAEKFSGTMTVSFLSPKRYISEPFVLAIRDSVAACSSSFSALVLKDGELLYIPSWNFCPLSDEANWAVVPHDESTRAAAISSIELFFMFYSPIIYNNFVSSRLVMLDNKRSAYHSVRHFGAVPV